MPEPLTAPRLSNVYIDQESAAALASVLREVVAHSDSTDINLAFRAGIECAVQTIEKVARACAEAEQ